MDTDRSVTRVLDVQKSVFIRAMKSVKRSSVSPKKTSQTVSYAVVLFAAFAFWNKS